MANLYAVIMAGGRGERFWPLSMDKLPKPFIPLLGEHSLIQDTVERIESLVPLEKIHISIGKTHLETAREQLPRIPAENFIVEPVGRDTSACLGFSALHIEKQDPDGWMLALPADHFIRDAEAFRNTIQAGMDNLEGATGVVFGIQPDRPETGYGYILAEKPASTADAWPVVRFIEKPDAPTAARYLAAGTYFWNSGMFLWRNRTLLDLMREHMPELDAGLCRLRPLIGRKESEGDIAEIFSELPRISIDFGIMEKISGLRLVPARFGWDDIGTWAALQRALSADDDGNICRGPHATLETKNCVLYAQSGTIAAFGVTDLIVVEAYGKVLVCPKNRASDLKKLVKKLDSPDK
jgi:mannose-1-phosphate guanylyltransferase